MTLEARAPAGLYYAVETLLQWLAIHRPSGAEAPADLPAVRIEDRPHFRHRGFLLDISRNRANFLAAYLRQSGGIPRDRIKAEAVGNTEAGTETPEAKVSPPTKGLGTPAASKATTSSSSTRPTSARCFDERPAATPCPRPAMRSPEPTPTSRR